MLVQIFWPSRIHWPSSRRARVRTAARSEPAPGSLNPWAQDSRTARILGRKRRFWAADPKASSIGPSSSRPCTEARYGGFSRAASSAKMISWRSVPPRPPYSAGQLMPSHLQGRQLPLPGDADVPRVVVGGPSHAAALRELAHQMLVEPGARFVREGLFLAAQGKLHRRPAKGSRRAAVRLLPRAPSARRRSTVDQGNPGRPPRSIRTALHPTRTSTRRRRRTPAGNRS